MKIKNILSVIAASLFALALTGCYEKFDDPAVQTRYDDQYFINNGYTIQSVKTVMELFADPSHDLVNHLSGKHGVTAPPTISGISPVDKSSYGRYYLITDKYVIKGKVTNNDVYGNFYRSLFIQDDTGGIEVKAGINGMYTKYLPGETIYVICEGLALGNYRSMLSLGLIPLEEDRSDSNEPYANKHMDIGPIVDKTILLGEKTSLTPADIAVIKAADPITDAQLYALAGKLVRFEGLVSSWEGGSPKYPSFLHKRGFNSYNVYSLVETMTQWQAYRAGGSVGAAPVMPEPQSNYIPYHDPINPGIPKYLPTWGFQEHEGSNTRNFCSALFTMAGYGGEIVIRTGGYSRFALKPVTAHGKAVNVTAIISRYTTNKGENLTYQLTVNDVSDIKEL